MLGPPGLEIGAGPCQQPSPPLVLPAHSRKRIEQAEVRVHGLKTAGLRGPEVAQQPADHGGGRGYHGRLAERDQVQVDARQDAGCGRLHVAFDPGQLTREDQVGADGCGTAGEQAGGSIHSDEKYTSVAWRDGGTPSEALIRMPLKELVAQLDAAHFVQVHRSVVVNLRSVSTVKRGENETADIHLKGRSEVLPVSRSYLHLFRQM